MRLLLVGVCGQQPGELGREIYRYGEEQSGESSGRACC